jgi:Interferon-induced transmembrane protein
MSYPPGPYEGSPGWQGQPPGWQPPLSQPPQPGWPGPQPGWQGQPEPDNYLVWAILCTVLCCLPFGIVSLVYSNKVSGLWTQGRYAEAQAAADNAKKWAIIGAIVGAVFAVIIVVLWVSFAVFVSNLPVTTTTTTYPGF